jgi:hypothetical protein
MLLSMAAYGDYNTTCPNQTFTEDSKLRNFPDSPRPPWLLIEEWDTPSGCSGFSAVRFLYPQLPRFISKNFLMQVVPEMNKVLSSLPGM